MSILDTIIGDHQTKTGLRLVLPQPFGAEVHRKLEQQAAEIERLRAGGCRRDQHTTQFCAEAAAMAKEIERLRGLLAEIASNHGSDGHFCGVCGAEGGRWPCATWLVATDAAGLLKEDGR